MTERKAVVEHVQIVRHHDDQPAHTRLTIVLDADTGRRIGHSPTHTVEQTTRRRNKDGSITTTLKISPKGNTQCS